MRSFDSNRWRGPQGRLLLLVYLMMALLALRLFHLQILQTENYQRQARENRFDQKRIPSVRGLVLDRRGRILAENLTACELSVSLRALDADSTLLSRSADLLGRSLSELDLRVAAAREAGRNRAVLDRSLDRETLVRVEEHLPGMKGLQLRDWSRRNYPWGERTAHLLGYVGEVSKEEILARRGGAQPFFPGDLVGRSGVERRWQDLLRGQDGWELFLVNARGTLLETVQFKPPVAGRTLQLTLDIELTAVLDSALAAWGCGAGVVMDVRTGELLALASRPGFDPNLFTGGIPPKLWKELSSDEGQPLFNRWAQATYSPASTIKPLVALAGLETGALGRIDFKPCTGGLQLGRRYFRCWFKPGHGTVDLEESLERSCDVYYYQLGEALGINRLANMSRRFGLGKGTGLDLGGDASGLVPDSDYYDRRYGKRGWTRGLTWNVSIGQGELLASPLQMARVYAGLANGRELPHPRLLLSVEGGWDTAPVRGRRLSVNQRHLDRVREGLRRVLHGTWGTARASAVPGLVCAGKTGTAQNPHGLEHAWFCGYAPAENPRIAVAIMVEHGEHGSDVAPIFRRIVEAWLASGEKEPLP